MTRLHWIVIVVAVAVISALVAIERNYGWPEALNPNRGAPGGLFLP